MLLDPIAFAANHPVTAILFGLSLVALVSVLMVYIYDVFVQRSHAIQHNFPVIGHLRYFMEAIGPELRQYWVANDKEELPFNRSARSWVYASAKGETNSFGFGTSEEIYSTGYPIIKHAMFPFPDEDAVHLGDDETAIPCLKVMGASHGRARPFRPKSIVNVSAMSFGSLGENAVKSINIGAKIARAYHNTGEGGVSPHHAQGADIIWQLGTGYYGARSPEGRLDMALLVAKVKEYPQIRAIEIKLSQGAKPGKGGILPGAKVTEEIAAIRGIPVGKDCLSPNTHREFKDVEGLIDLVERIADQTGLPVGIKSAVGELKFWEQLAVQMKERGQGPDYIQIDGGEGGTGAAPLTFSDHVSLPFKIGFSRVYQIFLAHDIQNEVVWLGSGKLGFPDRAVIALAMGCDAVVVAREAMMAIGCIQAQKCHTGHCPAGIATHDKWLQAGLDVDLKAERMYRYIKMFRNALRSLAHAAGYQHPGQFTGDDVEFSSGVNQFTSLSGMLGYKSVKPMFTNMEDYETDA
ncbi:MAG: FMN-binding glutamate synthase family protein [Rhodobacterales bacterium]|nr:FMN-binding glutamate synthase family protein [Rhodobacterales bacterium]